MGAFPPLPLTVAAIAQSGPLKPFFPQSLVAAPPEPGDNRRSFRLTPGSVSLMTTSSASLEVLTRSLDRQGFAQ